MSLLCYQDIGDHAQQCDVKFGGISGIAFLFKDHGITDFSDEAQWQAAIDAGTAKLVDGIAGEYPEPSPVESESLIGCGPENSLDAFDHTLTWQDRHVSQENVGFYNDLNQARPVAIVWYNCTEDTVSIADEKVAFQAMRTEGNNSTKQRFAVTAAWRSIDIPEIADAPSNIFE